MEALDRESVTRHMPVLEGYPRPDWPALEELIGRLPQAMAHDHWSRIARLWLTVTAEHLGSPYRVAETANFFVLTHLDARASALVERFIERAWKQIRSGLEGAVEESGYGQGVVMLFSSQEAYYEYSAHFYPDGEHPLSSGVFAGLPLPLWLNEGLAVTFENEICCNRPLRMDPDRMAEHQDFWNEETIQEFWSGRAFARTDEGNGLSYELARYCVRALAHDLAGLIAFTRRASFQDGGESAAVEVFGGSLGGLIEQFFGAGDWSPRVAP
jgi:hypothetical protein